MEYRRIIVKILLYNIGDLLNRYVRRQTDYITSSISNANNKPFTGEFNSGISGETFRF